MFETVFGWGAFCSVTFNRVLFGRKARVVGAAVEYMLLVLEQKCDEEDALPCLMSMVKCGDFKRRIFKRGVLFTRAGAETVNLPNT